ncbi:MAG: protein translocase subunit SecD [Actinomycetaceae bacterium]|nr:protein translocase subunit SecD [Actinomycetaceae bacterium]
MASRTHSGASSVPKRRLYLLVVLIAALLGSLAFGSIRGSTSRWAPEFALDLQGGTQIILTPVATDGSEVTQSDVDQAISIIRQRIDASGVAEAEISSQGGSNIVVGIPGKPSQETLELVRTSALLRMRPVLEVSQYSTPLTPAAVSSLEGQAEAAEGADGQATDGAAEQGDEAAQPDQAADPSATPESSATPSSGATYSPEELQEQATKYADANGDGQISDEPASPPANASDTAWITEQTRYEEFTLDCTVGAEQAIRQDTPGKAFVACDPQTGQKYILGPSEIEGTQIDNASSGWDSQRNQWVVNIEFNGKGGSAFEEVTGRISQLQSPLNQFSVVLDGKVISTAVPEGTISGGRAQISGGGIDENSSKTLANQLSFGSLPLQFQVQSEEQISATLGSESLRAGLYAGLIGLVLLVLYLLWTYRGLGIVAVASIVLATGVSYFIVSLLSWTIGYRLSMSGVVGFIISIGITADSFIVFFERIRDEIREGRSIQAAVSRGWNRAKRTIYVADACNLLCAIVLYIMAVGSVRGFAFTLGLTTILDLVVVAMFTYPVMAILVRGKFFGEGHRLSGMSAESLGHTPAYRGRGRALADARDARRSAEDRKDDAEDGRQREDREEMEGLSLAERKALARRQARREQAVASRADGSQEDID